MLHMLTDNQNTNIDFPNQLIRLITKETNKNSKQSNHNINIELDLIKLPSIMRHFDIMINE